MSTDFEKILVVDDRLNCTDKVKYQVTKGGQNVVSQSYKAISESSSGVVFNCVIPSLETIVQREILWTSTVTLAIKNEAGARDAANGLLTTHGLTDAMFLVNYGVDSALAPFPLHSLCNTMSATINNNTVTQNMQDTLPLILRMMDNEELAQWSSHTPTTLDFLSQYKDGVDKMEFTIGAVANADNTNARPAIFYPGAAETAVATDRFTATRNQKYISYPNNILSYDMYRPAGSSYFHKPRGSWVVNRIFGGSLSTPRTPAVGDDTIYVEFQVTEPLLLSPFTFGHPDHPGFYGISNLTFNFSFTPNASRAFRSVRWVPSYTSPFKTATIAKIEGSQLQMMFLTAHPSLRLSSRNVIPYYELPVYKTVQSTTLAARNLSLGSA